MIFNKSDKVAFTDVLLANDWNLDRTIHFMQTWVPTSFKVKIFKY